MLETTLFRKFANSSVLILGLTLSHGCKEAELNEEIIYSCTAPTNPLEIQRVLILGNSITSHLPDPERGWLGDWGMAASAESKDYVHILMDSIHAHSPEVVIDIGRSVAFEREYADFDPAEYYGDTYERPDLLLLRFGENVDKESVPGSNFEEQLLRLADYFTEGRAIPVVCASSFWKKDQTTESMRRVSEANNWVFVPLDDLDDVENMATHFDDAGLAIHPNDVGMERIAHRIWSVSSCLFGAYN